MAGLRVHFVFPAGLVERVDAALTVGQSRGEFVRAAVEQALRGQAILDKTGGNLPAFVPDECEDAEQALSEAKEPSGIEQADPGSVSSSEGVRSAAPAEQPDTRARAMARSASATYGTRSSVQAKRDVRPVPKAKP